MKKTLYFIALCMIIVIFNSCVDSNLSEKNDDISLKLDFSDNSNFLIESGTSLETESSINNESSRHEQISWDESSENSTENTLNSVDNEKIEIGADKQIVGDDNGMFASFSLFWEDFIKWLDGNSDKKFIDIEGKIVNIHDDTNTENARAILNSQKLYWLTLNNIELHPIKSLEISYHDNTSVRIGFISKDAGKETACSFFYYDETYKDTLQKGIVSLFERLKSENPDLWPDLNHSLVKYSLFDYSQNEYIDIDVLWREEARISAFVIDRCRVSIFDRRGLYQEEDYQHLGFIDMIQK